MDILVEIAGAVSGEETSEAYVAAFCQQAGGLLIGRRVNEQTHQFHFLVRFPDTASVGKHTEDLGRACQQHLIESFRYVSGGLVQISFDPSLNLREQMRGFPLRPDESWFPDIHNPHQAYVCMSRPVMLAKQAAWLLARDVAWSYV